MPRALSLAHLSLIGCPPREMARLAGAAGFQLVDLRLAPATPADRRYDRAELAVLARELPPLLAGADVRLWDVEIIRLNDQTEPADYLPLMETAARLGAARMKLVCDSEDHARAADILARLCRLAAPFGLTLDVEYMVFSGVKSLAAATRLVETAGAPNLCVLVDALHWARVGDTVADIRAATRLGYVQLGDAPARAPETREALIAEARTQRLPPGEGELALDDLLAAMPQDCVASLEVPLPPGADPLTHARRLYTSARALCDRHDRVTA